MNEYARCLTTRYGHQMTSRSNCNWKSRPGMEQKSWRIGYQSSRHPVTLNLVVSYIISLSNQLVGYKSRPTTISRVISLPPCEEEESTISVIRMEVNYFWTQLLMIVFYFVQGLLVHVGACKWLASVQHQTSEGFQKSGK